MSRARARARREDAAVPVRPLRGIRVVDLAVERGELCGAG